MAAYSELSVVATDVKPFGRRVSLSPWEFQTWRLLGSFLNNGHSFRVTVRVPLPYSRFVPFSTFPPKKCPINWTP